MHSFVVSNSFEPLIRAAWDWVVELETAEVLILAPNLGSADDFVRSPLAPPSPVASFSRRTLLRLASEIAIPALAEEGVLPVTGLAVEALCARAVDDAVKHRELTYFQDVADTPGMSRALSRTLLELRLQGTDLSSLETLGAAGQDLSRLGLRFEGYLRDDRLADSAVAYRLALATLNREEVREQLPILFFHLRPRFELEARFVAALARRAPAILAITLESDVESVRFFSELLEKDPRRVTPPEDGSRLQRLRSHLFSPDVPAPTRAAQGSTFEFFSAPGESRECVEIARRIRRAAEEGTRFDQMAVALRNPESYLPLLEDAFRRAGVPAYFSRGTRRPDPAGRAFLALLECAAEGLSATRFAEYLSLAQIPPREEPQEQVPEIEWVEPRDDQLCFKSLPPPPESQSLESEREPFSEESRDLSGNLRAPERWEQLLVDAAVIGGRDRWRRRLRGLENELKLQTREVSSEEPRRREHLAQKLFLMRNLKAFCLPLLDLLDGLPDQASWNVWLSRLEEISVRALQHPDSVLSVLAELQPMGEVEPVGLDEVRRVLGERLTLLREDPPANRYGRVTVAGIDELWGRSFDLVFLPALAEGLFPRKALEDPLLLDRNRQQLGLSPVLTRQRAEERLLLRVAVATASRRLVVSYPRIDVAQGRSRVPSFYALDVLRAAEGVLPDLDGLEQLAAEASSSRLGWPAPRDPSAAIDDTEFDLALLHPMLVLGPEGRRGRAQFLLKSNSHLARALRARAGRWRHRFFAADGLVDPPPEAVEILQGERLRQRSYSPTSLQQYAVCPYKFFLYAIHRLRVREEPVALQQLDPLTRGSLFHEVQFQFLSRLRAEGRLPVTQESEAGAMDRLDQVFGEVSTAMKENLAPAIPRIWEGEMEELLTDLRGWLREISRREEAWIPSHFELAFGLPEDPQRDPSSTTREVRILSGIRLRGSIDLVEIRQSDGQRAVRVTDHKTGRPPYLPGGRRLEVGGGEILQPIIYALAAEQLLDEEVDSGQLYYCTRRGEYQRRMVSIHSGTCAKLKQVLETIDRSLEQGFLPAAPRPDACTYCDFRSVCGPYEEIRIRRKDQSRLADLNELRKLP